LIGFFTDYDSAAAYAQAHSSGALVAQ
jgi:hypothetical protein